MHGHTHFVSMYVHTLLGVQAHTTRINNIIYIELYTPVEKNCSCRIYLFLLTFRLANHFRTHGTIYPIAKSVN